MADNPLTAQYGPLKGWQWSAGIGALGAVFLYLQARRKAAAAAASGSGQTTMATAADASGNPYPRDILSPIIIQQGNPSQPLGPTPQPPQPTPTPSPPKPQPSPSTKVNAKDFSQSVAANTATGKNMVAIGTVGKGGTYTGKNSSSGAPVYALIDTGYGPKTSFVQNFNRSKLPAGTKLYTLPQFASLFK